MDDVISLSSDSEEDSDVEFVSSFKDNTQLGVPFINAELLPVTPVLIDIKQSPFYSHGPRHSQKVPKLRCSTIEVIDLCNPSLPRQKPQSITSDHTLNETANRFFKSSVKSGILNKDGNSNKDVINLDSGDGQEEVSTNQHDEIHSCLEDRNNQKSVSPTHKLQNSVNVEETQNTKLPQKSSSPAAAEKDVELGETLDCGQSWLDKLPSPFSLDSSYHCPSEIDAMVFSDESWIEGTIGQHTTPSGMTNIETHLHKNSSYAQTLPTSCEASLISSLPCGQEEPIRPTSTEIPAWDFLEIGSDLDLESLPSSPLPSCSLSLPSPQSHLLFCTETVASGMKDSGLGSVSSEYLPSSQWMRTDLGVEIDVPEPNTQDGQQISLVQLRKLKHLIGGPEKNKLNVADEEHQDFGLAEPLCRQSLSLVYSTIEENYPEGTLQLLSDFIQPCYYPPADIISHLLKGILLEPQCSKVLAMEAYNLLMRTQKYHPADKSSIPLDWELLSSIMAEQVETKRLRSEVRCLLFQYMLKVLEDDFQFKLPMQQLHLSVANQMLSCDKKFRQVRELIDWLMDTAKQSFNTSDNKEIPKTEQNGCLKMLLILQRMLLLSMEVDLRPTCSSSKLSQELRISLNSQAPCRRLRFLLLSTLESNLLRCKLVELLLDQACSQKKALPMSFSLLLHFLHSSTLAPDPLDGSERWRRWDELLQLIWMLMLSYEEVITGHLRYPISERFGVNRTPMWTQNDRLTQAAVQEAAEAFLSRAVKDLGHDLPSHIQESLSLLQEHLLSISLHK
ncbi:SUMO-interacting motif-containing protein 1 isoform X2 [Trichomycterus rosablanca]|uniref:SUMO-interacting motif-containing protein 1 isoform X2 n=1 Tax=Trichomycterus rosablanca TaxID=2290929 RepID=UPI002F36033F